MNAASILGFGFLLLCAQTMAHQLLASQWLAPGLILPLVLYMAVGDFSLTRGATLSFGLGLLQDAFASLPTGLYTFTMVAVFLLSRLAGLKLFLHGAVFQILLTFVGALVAAVIILAMQLVFERNQLAMAPALAVASAQGLVSALLSPLVFALVRRLPGVELNRAAPQETGALARE